ncbi:MAG: tetratricopeptide repeat protein [Gammaproteobacteria bacterium]|nr:tetratricopeptide repeat protein [Gammaproteobacteria bacterium]
MICHRLRQVAFLVAAVLVVSACTGAESRKAGFVARGEEHMAAHDWQKARLEFRNALQIDPKDQRVQFLAAQAAERAGEYDEAAGRYRALLEQDRNNLPARTALGRLYAGGGLVAEAIKLAEDGLAAHPDDPGLRAVRGVARAMRGDPAGARQDAEAALARAPTDVNAAVLMASLLQRQGRAEEGLPLLLRASQTSPGDVGLRVIVAQALTAANRAGEAEQQLREIVKLEPNELKHRYRLAQFYLLQKKPDAAEQTLREAIRVAPDSVEAKLTLANLIAAQSSFETGEQGLKALVESDPKNYALQLGLGQFYETHQRPALADDVYAKVARAAGTTTQGLEARNRRAALALAANHSTDASRLIEEVLAANPRDNGALTMRANIALARGDTTNAIADARAVLRDQPNAPALMRTLAAAYAAGNDSVLAEETLRDAIRANPNDIPSRLALADLLMKTGRGEQAQPVADQLVTEQPGDVRSIEAAFRIQVQRRDFQGARKSAQQILELRSDLPAGHFLLGLVDEAEGKLDAALRGFERASALAPGAVEPIAAIARVELARKAGPRALERVNKALTAAPTSSRLLSLKSEILAQGGRYAESADAASQAIARAPAWWVGYHDLARAEVGRGRPEAAVAAYLRGLEATQSAPPLVQQLAALRERMGDTDDAIALYESWLKRDPGSMAASNNLAMLLITHWPTDRGRLDRALEYARRLEQSTQPEFLDTLGWVQYLRGDYAPAVAVLQRAVNAAPGSPGYRTRLGLAQVRAGMREEARVNLQRALSTRGSFPEAAEAKTALQQLLAAP